MADSLILYTNEGQPLSVEGISVRDVDCGWAVQKASCFVQATLSTLHGKVAVLGSTRAGQVPPGPLSSLSDPLAALGIQWSTGFRRGRLLTFSGPLSVVNEVLGSLQYIPDPMVS